MLFAQGQQAYGLRAAGLLQAMLARVFLLFRRNVPMYIVRRGAPLILQWIQSDLTPLPVVNLIYRSHVLRQNHVFMRVVVFGSCLAELLASATAKVLFRILTRSALFCAGCSRCDPSYFVRKTPSIISQKNKKISWARRLCRRHTCRMHQKESSRSLKDLCMPLQVFAFAFLVR